MWTHRHCQSHEAISGSQTVISRSRGARRWAARILLAAFIGSLIVGRLDAAPYYTATYVGPVGKIDQKSGSITNTLTGVSYAFTTTTTPITAADLQNLPSGTTYQGVSDRQEMPYTMRVFAINSSGTAIGSIPGNGGSNPWDSATLGYTVRSTDGHYSDFVPLTSHTVSIIDGVATDSKLHLSQANDILIDHYIGDIERQPSLLDLKTGVTTSLAQLMPPALLEKFPFTDGIYPLAIDDRGDILVNLYGNNQSGTYILTPSGLPAPVSAPEPSTLAIFGLIAGATGLRISARRRANSA